MHNLFLASSAFSGVKHVQTARLRQICLNAGADDVGFAELERPSLAEERPFIERAFPRTRTLISLVLRMNRDNIHSPAQSVSKHEFHQVTDEVDDVARRVVSTLEREGICAMLSFVTHPSILTQSAYDHRTTNPSV